MIVIALVALALALAPAAFASATSTIIQDASDGVVDGTYTAAQVRAALAVVRADPVYSQYSDIEGVLNDYLASLDKPGAGTGGGGTSGGSGGQTSTPASVPTAGATAKATHSPKPKPHPSSTPTPAPSATSQAGVTPVPAKLTHPMPSVTAWEQVRARLGAIPWFFVVVVVIVVAVGALLQRSRSHRV